MVEREISEYAWGAELVRASHQGAAEVARAAQTARASLDDETADEAGLKLADLLSLRIDPPGRRGTLAGAIAYLAGPRTIARVGTLLREDDVARWKVETGLNLLDRQRSPEAQVQLLLCATQASEFSVLTEARAMLRGYPAGLGQLMALGDVATPESQLTAFFTERLQQAMVQGTRYNAADFLQCRTTAARAAMETVVWARYEGRRPVDLFVLDPDGEGLISLEFEPVQVERDAKIGVLHPAEIAAHLRYRWTHLLADLEIVTPFAQLERNVFEAGKTLPFHRIDQAVDHWEFVGELARRGWQRTRESRAFDFAIRTAALKLETKLEPDARMRRLLDVMLLTAHVDQSGVEAEIVFSEAVNECVAVLEVFAPDVLMRS